MCFNFIIQSHEVLGELSLETKLKKIKQEIEETELNLRICDSRIHHMHNMRSFNLSDAYLKKDYESQIGKDTYTRIHLQNKLRNLMMKSFELQERILNGEIYE